MAVKFNSIHKYCFFAATFFAIFGYYAFLMILINLFGGASSLYATIPVRLTILLLLFFCLLVSFKLDTSLVFLSFLLFSLFYLIKIMFFLINPVAVDPVGSWTVLLYFLSFFFLPYLFITQSSFQEEEIRSAFWSLLISGLLFSIVVLFYYSEYLGVASRISQVVEKGDNYISPLALSYCSSLIIGLGLSYLFTNRTSKRNKILILTLILIACFPFILGASRGALVALVATLAYMFCFWQGGIRKVAYFVIFCIFLIGIFLLAQYYSSGAFERLFQLSADISQDSSSTVRLDIWRLSLGDFYNSPIFGSGLFPSQYDNYPHNYFIEVLMASGVVGFIPFFAFVVISFYMATWIILRAAEFSWASIFFFQSLISGMFSGSVYSAAWLSFSAALIFVIYRLKKRSNYLSKSLAGGSLA